MTSVSRIAAACLAFSLSQSGCRGGGSQNASFLLNAAQSTAPTIKGSVTTVASSRWIDFVPRLIAPAYALPASPADCKATYGYMCLGWEFFTLLREFDPAINETLNGEDKISSENMYYELNLAGSAYETLSAQATLLPSAVAIASPFNFGVTALVGETYDKAKNGITAISGFGYAKGEANVALRDDGSTKHFLIAIGSNDDSGWTLGRHKLVMQGAYNKTSGDIELNFVQYVQYPTNVQGMSDQKAILRTYIKGNEQTHYFEFQAGGTNTGSGPGYWNWSSIQGAGYSQGNGKHFLVFARSTNATRDSNNVAGAGTDGAYYCLAADATKASFGSAIYDKATGYTLDAVPSDCADYQATVSTMAKWQIANTQAASAATPIEPTTSDFPVKSDSSLYTGGGAQGLALVF